MDPILAGSLISAGGNLLGGMLNRDAVAKANDRAAWMQGQIAMYGPTIQAEAATAAEKATGINRLTMLGVPSLNAPPVVAGDPGAGVSAAGQDLGRAATAMLGKPSRMDLLNEQLLEAKIANVNADTVKQQWEASRMARTFADPATGPGVNVPLPIPAPWTRNTLPGEQRYRLDDGSVVIGPSQELSNATQTLAAGGVNLGLAPYFAKRNLINSGEIERAGVGTGIVRPDIGRGVTDFNFPWN